MKASAALALAFLGLLYLATDGGASDVHTIPITITHSNEVKCGPMNWQLDEDHYYNVTCGRGRGIDVQVPSCERMTELEERLRGLFTGTRCQFTDYNYVMYPPVDSSEVLYATLDSCKKACSKNPKCVAIVHGYNYRYYYRYYYNWNYRCELHSEEPEFLVVPQPSPYYYYYRDYRRFSYCGWDERLCDPFPCFNGGTCVRTTGACICPDGFTGELCNEPVSPTT